MKTELKTSLGFQMNETPTMWGTEFDVHLGIPQIVGFSESSPLCWILVSDKKPLYGEHLRSPNLML